MGDWSFLETAGAGGVLRLVLRGYGRGGVRRDVTTFRGAPTDLGEFTDADPFGDATARFTFPAITLFDDLKAPEIGSWLRDYSDVDLYWVWAQPAGALYPAEAHVINPLTQVYDVVTPDFQLAERGGTVYRTQRNWVKVWEGFLASHSFSGGADSSALVIECQGALFQVDRHLMKPFFPQQPWPHELLINEAFRHDLRPDLRVQPLRYRYPNGWQLKIPKYNPRSNTIYTPVGKPGSLWTGYTSRETGAWDHSLTGFVQDRLNEMITDHRSGVTQGNSWTLSHYRSGQTIPSGRRRNNTAYDAYLVRREKGRVPVLELRDRRRRPDFALWAGWPGVELSLAHDTTQSANIVFGEGTGVDGTAWRNAVVGADRTDYLPLAASPAVYPPVKSNPAYNPHTFTTEAYTRFGAGFDEPDAVNVAKRQLVRDLDPGYTGTITLRIDPAPTLSRWMLHAGMTLLLKGFAGSGEAGMRFHVASTTKSPGEGTVELTVDTRYRDLLTVEEARQRTRDPMNPVKMLQVGKASTQIEDIQAPWDYRAGSGSVPLDSRRFFDGKPALEGFPFADWTRRHPPHGPHKSWYVHVQANSGYNGSSYGGDGVGRWSSPVEVRVSERGTIARTEARVVDVYGRLIPAPFHLSFYYLSGINGKSMPLQNGVHSPYINNAFEPTDDNGAPNDKNLTGEQLSLIIGFGNKARGVLNRAGFSPGSEAEGGKPTGLFVDESQWTYDLTRYHDYYTGMGTPGRRPRADEVSIYAMFYCEWPEPVYFQAKLYRLNPGS